MIYFLYGPDTYRSRAKLKEIAAAFGAKAGGALGLTRVDAAETPETVLTVGRTASLFSAKELVVIENASGVSGEVARHLIARLKAWAKDANLTLVFWEGGINAKSSSLFGEIKRRAAKSQEFRPLPAPALERWIDAEAARRRMRMAPEEKRLLIGRHGADLWALANEMTKMESGWRPGSALREEEQVWRFVGAFFADRRRAFLPLTKLLAAGFEPVYLLGALASSVRRLVSGRARIAPAERERVASAFQSLLGADTEQKTGRLPSPLPLVKLTLKE